MRTSKVVKAMLQRGLPGCPHRLYWRDERRYQRRVEMLAPVPGHAGIYASENGHIWSVRSGRWRKLKERWGPRGRGVCRYLCVTIRDRARGNRNIHLYIHQAVCLAWHGEPPHWSSQVDHKNRKRGDNRASNLRWSTPDENLSNRQLNRSLGGMQQAHEDADELTESDLEEMFNAE